MARRYLHDTGDTESRLLSRGEAATILGIRGLRISARERPARFERGVTREVPG
jgi:hypothetical protein